MGTMSGRLTAGALVAVLSVVPLMSAAEVPSGVTASALVKKIQDEIAGKSPFKNTVPRALRGEMLRGSLSSPRSYPGTENECQVYVPKEYNPGQPACLLLKLDGLTSYEATVLDELIASHEMPVSIGELAWGPFCGPGQDTHSRLA